MFSICFRGLTPIRAANDRPVTEGIGGDTKVSELDSAVLRSQDIGTLNVTMYDPLFMQIDKAEQDLIDEHGYEMLWKYTECLADTSQRPIFAIFQNNVETVEAFVEAVILNNIGMLNFNQRGCSPYSRSLYIEVLQ